MMSRTGKSSSDGSAAQASRAGFTLLELLIVLAILSTLASIAVPNLRRVGNRIVLEEAAWSLASDLEMAHLKAIESGAQVELLFSKPSVGEYEIRSRNPSARQPWDFASSDPEAPLLMEAALAVHSRRLPGAPRLDPSMDRVVFTAEGMSNGASVTIGQAGSDDTYTVRLDAPTGQVTVHHETRTSR